MARRFVVLSILALVVVGFFAYAVLFNPRASASPQELTVISRTRGDEILTAVVVDNDVKIKLKNNHKDTITAFAIELDDTTIKADFVFSEVHFGIEPGDTFETSYALSPSPTGKLPTVYLLTVLLKNGQRDGNAKVAQEIEDVRLGNKIQILRTLRVLDKEGSSHKDIKTLKGEITAVLDAGDDETLVIKKELLPASVTDDSLSNNLKNGLHWGREKMLRKVQNLEQMPVERQEQGIIELRDRARELLAKL